MKFESKFGFGEILTYHDDSGAVTTRRLRDQLVKVVAVTFTADGEEKYTVENATSTGQVQRFDAITASLGGDPAYDQEIGAYPNEEIEDSE